MEPKYEIITTDSLRIGNETLYRIRALRKFGNVVPGEIGGYIKDLNCLSHDGNAWVSGDARVSGDAQVYGDARVSGNAKITKTRDYMCFGSFGSVGRTTTIFRTNSGIGVRCGCFYGNLEEFREKVKETHKDNDFAEEYLAIADIGAMRFEGGANNADNVRTDD